MRRWRLGHKIAAGYVVAIAVGTLGSLTGVVVADYFQGIRVMEAGNAATQDRLLSRIYRNLRTAHLTILQLETQAPGSPQRRRLMLQDLRDVIVESTQLQQELNEHLRGNPPWLVAPKDDLQQLTTQSLVVLRAYVATHVPGILGVQDEALQRQAIADASVLLGEKLDSRGSGEWLTASPGQLAHLEAQLVDVSQELRPLLMRLHSKLEQTEIDLETAQGLEKGIIVGSLLVSALLAGTIALGVTRQITRPLMRVTAVAERVVATEQLEPVTPALGDLPLETEVAVLARSLDTLMSWVAHRNQELATKATQAQNQAQTLQNTLGDLKRTQTQLIQTEKMSLLGQVAAGVAHEINNPVSFIYGNLVHLSSDLQDLLALLALYESGESASSPEVVELTEDIDLEFLKQDMPKLIQSMQSGSERIREIVLSLRLFTRLDESALKTVNVNESLDSVVTILRSRLCPQDDRPAIELVQNYGELPLVECYAGQLNQVLMHLLTNAIDALEQSWQQTLPQKNAAPDNGDPARLLSITLETLVLNDNRIAIAITDTGPGIPDTVLPNIFEMFYTTKQAGKGTGMGLAIAHQVITEQHRGTITCDSVVGQGTTFRIELPCRQPLTPTDQTPDSPDYAVAVNSLV